MRYSDFIINTDGEDTIIIKVEKNKKFKGGTNG